MYVCLSQKDFEAMFKFTKDRADYGDFNAQKFLGDVFYEGRLVAQNYIEAANCYRDAAENGCVDAQYRLAEMYTEGKGVEKDLKKAQSWYKEAFHGYKRLARLGYTDISYIDAQHKVGEMCEEGLGIEQNAEESLLWYEMALEGYTKLAKHGDSLAKIKLAEMYISGDGIDVDDYNVNEDYYWREAIDLLQESATDGNVDAAFILHTVLEKICFDENVKDDSYLYEEADYWLRKAAEGGNIDAQLKLADVSDICDMYDDSEKIRWCKRLANQGYTDEQFKLGMIYYRYHCDGGDENGEYLYPTRDALRWFKEAAEKGHKDAQYMVGNLLSQYYSDIHKKREAIMWHKMAAEQGKIDSQYALGDLYDSETFKNPDEASIWYKLAFENYRKLALQDDNDAQLKLGSMFYDGKGTTQDYCEALVWYKKATHFSKWTEVAAQSAREANYLVGNMYLCGHGVEKNEQMALGWFEKAALCGHKIARRHVLESLDIFFYRDNAKEVENLYNDRYEELLEDEPKRLKSHLKYVGDN